ncbi:hypothetical protein NLG97_g6451 [Lecanicillium saksenae]|uniref:Uncharacterized protein n=1 Tax=Lecanicillium saksenae TaxID=468837 RepID=A0ACC1QSP4_9HYPO|nr:hypothetical protein NLG97_g6451 [Lecanicillium saksenae]
MGPVATMAMADEGSGDASSRKLHPFFVKTPAFEHAEASAMHPPTHAHDEHETKRARTNDYTPAQEADYTATQPISYTQQWQQSDPYLGQFQATYQQPVSSQQQSMIAYANAPQYDNTPAPYYPTSQTPHPIPSGTFYASTFPTEPPAPYIQPDLPVVYPEAAVPQASMSVAPIFQAPISQIMMPQETVVQMPVQQPLRDDTTESQPSSLAPTPDSRQDAPPKKVLKFNMKTGTLGSPPKPKPAKSSSKIVTMKYGRTPEDRIRIGDKISQILAGQLRVEGLVTKAPEPKAKRTAKDKPQQSAPKTTHPFFAKDKRNEAQPSSDKKRNTVFMSTPVSPRKPRNNFSSGKGPSFGIRSTGTKVPGAKHPLWPPHGFGHIRGYEQLTLSAESTPINRLKKKSKGQTVSINSHESILGQLSRQLDFQTVKRSLPKNENTFPPPPTELRLPKRHFESGCKLAKRLRPQIRSNVPCLMQSKRDADEDELAREPSKPVHPIINRHWQSLAQQLSAFDRSTCESVAWVTKYAPTTAAEVLQPGREVTLLKQWLEMLRVQGVESAGDGSAKSKAEAKKKKRKSKLDGFVVDSEDESGEMNELSDLEDPSPGAKQRSRPSVARSLDLAGKDPSKLANTLLISGPHGSGKSAAVYAVAKELGFEVFEINSSTRRSGKDILERVGDMTRNHLVQHHRSEAADSTEATESDISSGKQGMMTSFFKPKAPAEKKKKSHDKSRAKADAGNKSSSTKSQKQSLILLEEVDILFDEDKQFWASLQSLMSQSKRPFILTCNDESAVPMNTLNLHGMFRFLPAPEQLAVDTCLLIAANEGHALKRDAVQSLYRCRDHDLRATITDLQFWCQIGVGDRRGGHDWFYLRWPKGIDVDKEGQVVRVISEDTYQTGMGWLSRDRIATAPNTQAMEQEAAEQAWQFWHRDVTDWHGNKDLKPLGAATSAKAMSRHQRLQALDFYTDYYDALSCADISAAGVLGVELDEMLDPTLPAMPEAMKDDFIIAQPLLEADPLQPHFCSRAAISSCISTLALANLKTSVASVASSAEHSEAAAYDEQKTTRVLEDAFETDNRKLTRYDVAVAFDPIAVSPKAVATMSLDPSVFDRTMTLIVVEVAPWVRGIVHYDDQLMQDRQRLNELLNEGGRRKRMRTTRAAYSALEGGERRTTRKERYFGDCLSTDAVMYTAGDGWQEALPARENITEPEDIPVSSPMSIESTEGITLGI